MKPLNQITFMKDFLGGLFNFRLWYYLAKFDIRGRYRRTVLGPLWTSLNALLFVMIIAGVYAQFSNKSVREFLPYVSAGYFIWIFVSTIVLESCSIYFAASSFLKTSPLSPIVLNARVVARNFIVFLHSLAVFIIIAVLSGVSLAKFFWVVPAMLLLSIICLGASITLSVLCSRYRDIEQLVNSIILAAFFVTPILYDVRILENSPSFLKYNIFTYMINIVRNPMLGVNPDIMSYSVCGISALISMAMALTVYWLGRKRLFLWI